MTVTTAQIVNDTGFGQISASTMNNYSRRLQLSLPFLFYDRLPPGAANWQSDFASIRV